MPARRTARVWMATPFVLVFAACTAAKPTSLGLVDRRLAPCPPRPGCVSTQEEGFGLGPLRYEGSRDEGRRRLVEVLRTMPGARVMTVAPHYVRAELTSSVFGSVDDVEAFLDPDDGVIHLRSASRIGYYDFGANRRRLAEILRRFEGES